jgi:hypothetical protein
MTQVAQNAQGSAAVVFWNEMMKRHPKLHGWLAIAGAVLGFFLNGHFLVAAGRWVIQVSGYVAETALLFAVLWISGTSIAPSLIEIVMSKEIMAHLVMVALITLALIPEIILANAIINAVKHWITVGHDRRHVMSWVWAFLFTIPTLMFLALTAYTLNSLGSNGGNFVQASTDSLNFRMDAGWIYGLLEVVYAGVRKLAPHLAVFPQQKQTQIPPSPVDYERIIASILPVISVQITAQMTAISASQIQSFESQIAALTASFQAAKSMANEPDMSEDINADMQVQMEPISSPISNANGPLTRADLGMIEGVMYDKLMADKSALNELHMQSQMMPISDFVISLQGRFSAYANYINEGRVLRVMEAINAAYLVANESPNEPDMSAQMSPISDVNDAQIEIDMEDDMPANITDISTAKPSQMTRKLADISAPNASNMGASNDGNMGAKKGPYAITKEAASELLKCPISEIERGISAGQITEFAKDKSKVLRSSLQGFVPQKRVRKTGKMAVVNS